MAVRTLAGGREGVTVVEVVDHTGVPPACMAGEICGSRASDAASGNVPRPALCV